MNKFSEPTVQSMAIANADLMMEKQLLQNKVNELSYRIAASDSNKTIEVIKAYQNDMKRARLEVIKLQAELTRTVTLFYVVLSGFAVLCVGVVGSWVSQTFF